VINGGTLQVGTTPTPSGSLLVTGNMIIDDAGSTVTVAGLTGIGIFGPGTLTISNGGVLNSQIGAEIDSIIPLGTPTVTVTGTGSTWNVGGSLGFGFAVGGGSTGGPGVLVISNGGTVTSTVFTTIGDVADGSSRVLVTGAGSVFNAFNSLQIGDTSCGCGLVGTLTVADGGVVNAPGATSIAAGSTLNLGIGGLAGTIVTPAIANDGQIVANFTDTSTLGANVSGTGSLSKAGAGTLILTGNGSYTGGTTINAGTLQLGNGGASGSIAGNVINNGVFAINRSDTYTFGGVISGTGAFAQLGTGTTILTAVNSYSGGSAIAAGTLAVGADNNLGAAAGGVVFAGSGTLQFLSSFTTSRAVTLNATGTFDTQGNTDTLAGAISGVGGLSKIGAGTLTLAGASSYAGATSVNAGTLQAGATNAFAPLSAFTVASGATLNLASFNQTIGSLAGAGAVTLGSATLTTGTDNTSTTFSGTISGSGALAKIGNGTLTLSGANTYTGGTTINAGTLQLGNGGASGSIAGNVINNGVFAINRSDTFTFGGVISGTGAFAQLGSGTTILTAVNSYSGGSAIAAGTLAVGADNNLGAAAGGVVFAGSGTLQFLSSFTTSRAVTLNATGTFDTQGNTDTLAGAISGVGGLSKIGAGTLTLAGASSYAGATSVNAGTLQAGATNAFAPLSAFTVASGATLNLASFNQTIGSLAGAGAVTLGSATLTTGTDNTSTTFAGTISGSGSLIKVGTGTLTLAGANTYTGGTTLAGGTLSLANNQALGSGALTTIGSVVDYASGVTIANAIVINSNTTQLQVLSGSATSGRDLRAQRPAPAGEDRTGHPGAQRH
jgi:fibronectin-binding autotransporter adhesin